MWCKTKKAIIKKRYKDGTIGKNTEDINIFLAVYLNAIL